MYVILHLYGELHLNTCMMKTSCRTSSLLFMMSRCNFHPARLPSNDCLRMRLAFVAMLSPYALQGYECIQSIRNAMSRFKERTEEGGRYRQVHLRNH